jgi:hypothetical protein
MIFISSLTRIPPDEHDLVSEKGVLPDHLFLDDQVALGFGRYDEQAMTVVVDLREAISGHQLCIDV